MNKQLPEMFNPLTSKFSKQFMQFGELSLEAAQSFGQQMFNTADELLSLGTKHAQNLMNVKKPEEMLNLHANFLSTCAEKSMSNMQNLIENSQNLSAKFNKLIQSNLKSSAEEIMPNKSAK